MLLTHLEIIPMARINKTHSVDSLKALDALFGDFDERSDLQTPEALTMEEAEAADHEDLEARREQRAKAEKSGVDHTSTGDYLKTKPKAPSAPCGLEPSTYERTTQGTVFDAIESIEDSSAKATAYNALVGRSGFACVMSAHTLLKNAKFEMHAVDMDDDANGIRNALVRNAALFNYAGDEALTYATNTFEQPQAFDALFERALKQSARKVVGLSKEEAEAAGLSEFEIKSLEKSARERAERDAKAVGDSLEAHKHDVKALVLNTLDNVGSDDPSDRFDATQHDALYEAVVKRMDTERARMASIAMQYDGDFRNQMLANARELNEARKIIEKHRAAFRRANMNEIRHAA